jgi:hypothetical protein
MKAGPLPATPSIGAAWTPACDIQERQIRVSQFAISGDDQLRLPGYVVLAANEANVQGLTHRRRAQGDRPDQGDYRPGAEAVTAREESHRGAHAAVLLIGQRRRRLPAQSRFAQGSSRYPLIAVLSRLPVPFLQQRHREESHCCAPGPINALRGIRGPTGMYS